MRTPWFKIRNSDSGRGEIYLYGAIVDEKWYPEDQDVTPVEFRDELKKLDGVQNIDMYINSPGGNVFAGMAIYHMLKRSPANITAHVDGIAASIAFVIAMAADKIVMPKTSMVLAHKAMIAGIVAGNADDFVRMAEQLEAVDGIILEAFKAKTGMSNDDLMAVMRKDAYMGAEEAVRLGFVDGYEEAIERAPQNAEAVKFNAKAYLTALGIDNAAAPVVEPKPFDKANPDYSMYDSASNLRNFSLNFLEA